MSHKILKKYDPTLFDGMLSVIKQEHIDAPVGVLKDAEKINLVRVGVDFPHTQIYQPWLNIAFKMLEEEYGKGTCPLAILLTINPGCEIALHKDQGDTNKVAKRHHFPLVSNEGVLTTMGSVTFRMLPGEMWILDTFNTIHGTVNKGTVPRTHLIVDWIPN